MQDSHRHTHNIATRNLLIASVVILPSLHIDTTQADGSAMTALATCAQQAIRQGIDSMEKLEYQCSDELAALYSSLSPTEANQLQATNEAAMRHWFEQRDAGSQG